MRRSSFLAKYHATFVIIIASVTSVVVTASTPHVFVTWTRIEDPIPPSFPSSFRIEDRHVQHKHRIVIAPARPKAGRSPTASADLDLFGTCSVHLCVSFQWIKHPTATCEGLLVGFEVSSRGEFRIAEAGTWPHLSQDSGLLRQPHAQTF